MTYTMFEVSDGNSFSQRYRKPYRQITHSKTVLKLYDIPLLLKSFRWQTKFQGRVSGFLGFSKGNFLVDVFENVIVE